MSNLINNFFLVIAIALAASGVPAFIFTFQATQNWQQALAVTVLCETAALFASFLSKVWQRLEGKWTERLADWLDLNLQNIFSGYRKQYLEYIVYQHRVFDVKGIVTQGPYNLELGKVFVELSVEPTAPHKATSDPINSDSNPTTRKESPPDKFTIWKYLVAKNTRYKNLAILGGPGSGKTTLLKHIALTLATPTGSRHKSQAQKLLPILLFLREHANDIKANPDLSLAQLIHSQFKRKQISQPPTGWLESQIQQGNCLVMLDGLDEIADVEIRKSVIAWVEQCMTTYGRNRFILSSRPHGYRNNPVSNVTVLQIRPFTIKQVQQFAHNWYLANEIMSSQKDDPGVRSDARQGANDLIKRIYSNSALSDLAVNPLLLTMIATVHRYRSALPGRRVELYAEICEVFLGRRQQARGLTSDLTPAQKQCVLETLACYLMVQQKRDAPIDEAEKVIAESLKSVSPDTNGKAFLKEIENCSGLLLERENGLYGFAHLTFQEYLASTFLVSKKLERILTQQILNPWWHETIRLYCAQTDASKIISDCLATSATQSLALALECMDEAREVQPKIRQQYQIAIEKGLENPDPEQRRLIAEAKLISRLRKAMHRVSDHLYVDFSMITCAEYQLFIDEMCFIDRYFQPDHWNSYRFGSGYADKPILGVRSSDAIAFCEWLTEREIGEWRYRLLTPQEANSYPLQLQSNTPIGYWTLVNNERSNFSWVGPIRPKYSFMQELKKCFPEVNLRKYGITYDKIDDIRDLVSDLASIHQLFTDSNLSLNMLPSDPSLSRSLLNRSLTLEQALAFDQVLDRNLQNNKIRHLSIDQSLTNASALVTDLERAQDRTTAFAIVLDLIALQGRLTGHYLAFEGIRIVKERKS